MSDRATYWLIVVSLSSAAVILLALVVRGVRRWDREPDLSDVLRRRIDLHNAAVMAEFVDDLDDLDEHFASLPVDPEVAERIYVARAWADITSHLRDIDHGITEGS